MTDQLTWGQLFKRYPSDDAAAFLDSAEASGADPATAERVLLGRALHHFNATGQDAAKMTALLGTEWEPVRRSIQNRDFASEMGLSPAEFRDAVTPKVADVPRDLYNGKTTITGGDYDPSKSIFGRLFGQGFAKARESGSGPVGSAMSGLGANLKETVAAPVGAAYQQTALPVAQKAFVDAPRAADDFLYNRGLGNPLPGMFEAAGRGITPGLGGLSDEEYAQQYGPGPYSAFEKGVPIPGAVAPLAEEAVARTLGRLGRVGQLGAVGAELATFGPADLTGAQASGMLRGPAQAAVRGPGPSTLGLQDRIPGGRDLGPRRVEPAPFAQPVEPATQLTARVQGTPGVIPAAPDLQRTTPGLLSEQQLARQSMTGGPNVGVPAKPVGIPAPTARGVIPRGFEQELTTPHGQPSAQATQRLAADGGVPTSEDLARDMMNVRDEASAEAFWQKHGQHIESLSESEQNIIGRELSRRMAPSLTGKPSVKARSVGAAGAPKDPETGLPLPEARLPKGRMYGANPPTGYQEVFNPKTKQYELVEAVPHDQALSVKMASDVRGPGTLTAKGQSVVADAVNYPAEPAITTQTNRASVPRHISRAEPYVFEGTKPGAPPSGVKKTPEGTFITWSHDGKYGTVVTKDGSYFEIRDNGKAFELRKTHNSIGTPALPGESNAAYMERWNRQHGLARSEGATPVLGVFKTREEAAEAAGNMKGLNLPPRLPELRPQPDAEGVVTDYNLPPGGEGPLHPELSRMNPGEWRGGETQEPTGLFQDRYGRTIDREAAAGVLPQGKASRMISREQAAQQRLTRQQEVAAGGRDVVAGPYATQGAAAMRNRALQDPLSQAAARRGVEADYEVPSLDELVTKLHSGIGGQLEADVGRVVSAVSNKMAELARSFSNTEDVSRLLNKYYGDRAMMFANGQLLANILKEAHGPEQALEQTTKFIAEQQAVLRKEFIEQAMKADPRLDKRAADELVSDLYEAHTAANKLLRKMVGVLKTSKVLYSPTSYINNIVGNIPFALLGGGGLKTAMNGKALRELTTKGAAYNEALRAGLFGSEFFAQDTKAFLRALADDMNGAAKGDWQSAIALNARKGHRNLAAFYDGIDKQFKLGAFMEARARGLSPEDAVEHVYKYFPNYEKLAAPFQQMRKSTLGPLLMNPFMAFPLESMRIFKNVVKEHPARAAAAVVGLAGIYNYGITMGEFTGIGPSRQEIKDARAGSPSYRSFGGRFTVPYGRDENGGVKMLDVTNWIPLLDLFSNDQPGDRQSTAERLANLPLQVAKQTFLRGLMTSEHYQEPGTPGFFGAIGEMPGKLARGEVRDAFGDVSRTSVGQAVTPPLLARALNLGRQKRYEEKSLGARVGRDLQSAFSVNKITLGNDAERRRRAGEIKGQLRTLTIERARVATDTNISEATREARLANIEKQIERVSNAQ